MKVRTGESPLWEERETLDRTEPMTGPTVDGRSWARRRPKKPEIIAVRGQSPPTPPERRSPNGRGVLGLGRSR
jgi:hypothetical protein